MQPSLTKLQNILKLEADRGYDNGSVLGGLDKMLDPWEAEARVDQLNEDLIRAVVTRLHNYPRLSPKSRQETLHGLWRRIKRDELRQDEGPSEAATEPVKDAETEGEQTKAEGEDLLLSPAEGEPEVEKERIPDKELEEAEPVTAQKPEKVVEEEIIQKGEPDSKSEGQGARKPAPHQYVDQPAALDASVQVLPGIGERHGTTLARLGLFTLGDMLYHFPRRYDDYTEIKPINRLWYGQEVTVIGTISQVNQRPIHNKRLKIVEAMVTDGSGTVRITWFNQPWIAKRLRPGTHVVLSGKVEQYLGRLTMNNPEWELLDKENLHTNRIVPVYPLTARLTQRWLRRMMHKVVTYWAPRVQDPLPDDIRRSAELLDLAEALFQAHFPGSMAQLKAARHRIAFDEIFLLQVGVIQQKKNWQGQSARAFEVSDEWIGAQFARLPFKLTSAQKRSHAEMRRDLGSGRLMNRLLQGDVGSGKTVIAALAISIVAESGAQSALMAPTSILAEQHYANMLNLLTGERGSLDREQIKLIIGGTPESEKRQIREELASGQLKLIVGTHALIEDPVTFPELELIVIDEQHRFGVKQRAALRAKGTNPHLLVMTATPIPRSLALTVYGDLDLSVIDEMPPGRQDVGTYVLYPRERERAYTLIQKQVSQGNQAFIIYPLVEEREKQPAKAAVEEYRRLQKEVFLDYNVGLLHGRMKAEDKETVMSRFRDGELQILVSTTVVEVGVDIPNATVMLVEGANRFGLAQLHQLRGRVGRGPEKAHCILIPETDDAFENERLQAMVETTDGFVLAERDLEQRGPGEFLGTQQSGFSELQMAKLTDVKLIEKARFHAQKIFEQDPNLEDPQYQPLVKALDNFWGEGRGDIS